MGHNTRATDANLVVWQNNRCGVAPLPSLCLHVGDLLLMECTSGLHQVLTLSTGEGICPPTHLDLLKEDRMTW